MRFQEKLFVKIRRFLTLMFMIILIVFVILYLSFMLIDHEHTTRTRMDTIEENIEEVASLFEERLSSLSLNSDYLDIFHSDEYYDKVKLDNYNFTRKLEYKTYFSLVDLDNNVLYHNVDISSLDYEPYRDIIFDRVLETGQQGILTYRAVNKIPAIVFYGPIYHDTDLLGIASYYIYTSDLSYYILNIQGDFVVTDKYNNVIVSSRKTFINKYNKFNGDSSKITIDDIDYRLVSRELEHYNLYYLDEINEELGIYLIVLLITILLTLGLVYLMATKFMRELIKNNANSINNIIDDINIISSGNLKHKVDTNLDEDFGNLATNINTMIDKLNEELKRNEELHEINLLYERKKLDAQFNPHLLYNSLETIRYSMKFDQAGTEKFILNLNEILRYSIDNTVDFVKVREDLNYIKKYLELQHYRLGDKFTWNFEIDDSILDLMIPKLTLQPLIENSLKYGFKNQNNLHVDLIGYKEENKVILEVKDNGTTLDENYVKEINELLSHNDNNTKHIGLHNIARRVKIMYPSSKVYLESKDGTCVFIVIEGDLNV